jgi:hypothetical protein
MKSAAAIVAIRANQRGTHPIAPEQAVPKSYRAVDDALSISSAKESVLRQKVPFVILSPGGCVAAIIVHTAELPNAVNANEMTKGETRQRKGQNFTDEERNRISSGRMSREGRYGLANTKQ